MSSRLTYASVKPMIARILSMNTTDARAAEYCSRAQERLLHKGKWVGTYGRFRVCVNDGCLTWPREIETIEAAAICGCSIDIRNEWYEFLGNGPGVVGENTGIAGTFVDRGDACAFDDVKGTGKKLAVYCDGTEAAGAKILLRYYRGDSNAKMYTTVSGQSTEGEYITLPAGGAYAYSTYECMAGGFYDVVKPATLRTVRIYEYTVAGGALKPLAYYEPDETNPVYRRSVIPCLSNSCGGDVTEGCGTSAIDIMGKFRHRAVSKDSDSLIIQSAEALRLMVQCLRKEEDNLWDDSMKYEARATAVLDQQLSHWIGHGAVVPIRMVGSGVWGGAIPNLV